MRFSKAYIKTLKETPKEAEIASHKLMLRAAMIKKLASGIYAYLPLGYRTIRKIENIDLIVAGRQAIDGDTAQVGPQIAEHLDLPQVSYVKEMKYNEASKSFEIKRATEDGYFLLELPTPGLVTVLAEANQPRYMNVGAIVDVFERPIETWTFDDIEIDPAKIGLAGSPTKVNKSFTKGVKEPGVLHEVDAKEAANIILEKLKEKFII